MVSETHVGHVPVEGGHHPAKPEPELGRCEIRMLRLSSFCHSVMLRRKERKKMILIKEPTKIRISKGEKKDDSSYSEEDEMEDEQDKEAGEANAKKDN